MTTRTTAHVAPRYPRGSFSVAVNRARGVFCQIPTHTASVPGQRRHWVPVTFYLPYPVVPRPGVPAGPLQTKEEVLRFHFSDLKEVCFDQAQRDVRDPRRLP